MAILTRTLPETSSKEMWPRVAASSTPLGRSSRARTKRRWLPSWSGGASGSWGASGGGVEGLRDGRYEQKDDLVALMKRENPGVAQDRLRWEIETDDTLSRSCHSLVTLARARDRP